MKVGLTSKIVACMENKKVVPWHQALAGYTTALVITPTVNNITIAINLTHLIKKISCTQVINLMSHFKEMFTVQLLAKCP